MITVMIRNWTRKPNKGQADPDRPIEAQVGVAIDYGTQDDPITIKVWDQSSHGRGTLTMAMTLADAMQLAGALQGQIDRKMEDQQPI